MITLLIIVAAVLIAAAAVCAVLLWLFLEGDERDADEYR